ncbi:MAG: hypothetical protein ACNA8W_23400, partial [Bradymonadaceae bacterium]
RLRDSIVEAMDHRGFAFIEVISPCPPYYGRLNRLDEGIKELRYYWDSTSVDSLAPVQAVDLAKKKGLITVGKFIHEERPTWLDLKGGEQVPEGHGTNGVKEEGK